jgi:hypothetical protein
MWHYAIPTADGRWAVAYSVPGSDRWTPVLDCPTEQAARAEADRLNGGLQAPVARQLVCDWHQQPETVQ